MNIIKRISRIDDLKKRSSKIYEIFDTRNYLNRDEPFSYFPLFSEKSRGACNYLFKHSFDASDSKIQFIYGSEVYDNILLKNFTSGLNLIKELPYDTEIAAHPTAIGFTVIIDRSNGEIKASKSEDHKDGLKSLWIDVKRFDGSKNQIDLLVEFKKSIDNSLGHNRILDLKEPCYKKYLDVAKNLACEMYLAKMLRLIKQDHGELASLSQDELIDFILKDRSVDGGTFHNFVERNDNYWSGRTRYVKMVDLYSNICSIPHLQRSLGDVETFRLPIKKVIIPNSEI